MSRYHFNLASLDLQPKRLCSLNFRSLEAAETAAVLYAKAVARRTAELHEGWLEVQDSNGLVCSVVSIGAQTLRTNVLTSTAPSTARAVTQELAVAAL
jgi:hypothetical protein